jgi:hypothetical protein
MIELTFADRCKRARIGEGPHPASSNSMTRTYSKSDHFIARITPTVASLNRFGLDEQETDIFRSHPQLLQQQWRPPPH